ncbi:Trm112 family protein [Edaphobacter dinghuensis]|nr:Trm112 family protein [Edaphobacter dinghuensis]
MNTSPLLPEDLRWVVCPVCHQPLESQPESIRCTGCLRRYPLVDGIPVLLADRTL